MVISSTSLKLVPTTMIVQEKKSPAPPSPVPTNRAQDSRRNTTPGRKAEGVASVTQSEVCTTLAVSRVCCKREVRRKHRSLARKCHPGKWCEECNFAKAESEEVLKNLSNAHALLGREQENELC